MLNWLLGLGGGQRAQFADRIWDFWGENGKNRERVGELMQRVGLGNFLEALEVEPVPEMVAFPRRDDDPVTE